jgi:translation initiation factor IF-3
LRRNEQIRISPVRVIGSEGEQLGILPTSEAMRLARETGEDLVEVAPNVRPPVCRVMDYGKWKYLQKKKVKKSHEQTLKEVRLRPRTDDHDLEIKVKAARSFLDKGCKVQFTMRFRGRERAHREIALDALRQIATQLAEQVKVERPPIMDGRNMVMVLAPAKLVEKPAAVKEARPARPAPPPSLPVADPPAAEPLAAEPPATDPPGSPDAAVVTASLMPEQPGSV